MVMTMFKKKTIDLVKDYLRRYGWSFEEIEEPDEKQGLLVVPWKGLTGEGHMLLIDPMEEKSALVFRVIGIAKAPLPGQTPADRLNDLLLAMAASNYSTILGGWAYDPRDGEVMFKFAIPVHGAAFEYEDFQHCMAVAQLTVETVGPVMKRILDGTMTAQEFLEAEGLAVPALAHV
jgi:hypothetical protein